MRVRSPHHAPTALRTTSRIAAALTLFALVVACTPDQRLTAPNKGVAARNGVPFTEGLASPAW